MITRTCSIRATLLHLAWLCIAGALLAGCGEDPTRNNPAAPTTPTSPTSPTGIVARIDVKVDEAGSRDAVASLSEVVVDASTTSGTGALTYSIDFGDGSVADGPMARHVYASPGTYMVRCETKDSTGQTASASRTVVVKTLVGNWSYAGYVPGAKRVEVWLLAITAQDGLAVRGFFRNTDERDKPFTGTLTRPRQVQIAVSDGPSFDGAIPGRLGEEGEFWTLATRSRLGESGSAAFHPILAEADTPAPDAVFRVRLDSFGAAHAIAGLSPIDFDASASRGTNLSYFIEFGDGALSNEQHVVHPVDPDGALTARLTVVDRFGRSDSESFPYYSYALNTPSFNYFFPKYSTGVLNLELTFTTRNGRSYGGTMRYGTASATFVADLTGERDLHITAAALGIELDGYLAIRDFLAHNMFLTETRGPDPGATWILLLLSDQ